MTGEEKVKMVQEYCRKRPNCAMCKIECLCTAATEKACAIIAEDAKEMNVPTEKHTSRGVILDEAKQTVCSDRNKQYGEPEDNFAVIASYWNTYLAYGVKRELTAEDVANMMVLFKMGRITTQAEAKRDSYVDAAGYIACAGEIAMRGGEKE